MCDFPESTCHGQGFMPTRDICIIPQELPYQQRAFEPNLGGKNIPQMFCGGTEGYTMHVNIESGLRQITTRDPDSCSTMEFRDHGNMIPLLCEWQQPDYRPLFFTDHTRNIIKDIGRDPAAIYDQANHSAYKSDGSSYAQDRFTEKIRKPNGKKCRLGYVKKSVY